MLLTEIRPTIPIATKKVQIPIFKNVTPIKSGIQGIVQKYQHRPNTIVKIALTFEKDAYEVFLQTAMKRCKLNPFFPNIKSVKKYIINPLTVDEYYDLLKKVNMSTHLTITQPILNQMKWMNIIVMEELVEIERSDIKDEITKQIEYLVGSSALEYGRMYRRLRNLDLRDLVVLFNNDMFYRLALRYTPNPLFKQALRLIKPIINKHRADFHLGNFMARITSTGPELVIIDPVYQGLYSGELQNSMLYTGT